MITRSDLKEISRLRVKEAKILIKNGCYSGGYYLIGYSIECALKACIAKKTRKHQFPDKDTVIQSYSHDLNKLIGVAGLGQELARKISKDKQFETKWAVVAQWKEDSRYEVKNQKEADDLLTAVTNKRSGVLKWIKTYW